MSENNKKNNKKGNKNKNSQDGGVDVGKRGRQGDGPPRGGDGLKAKELEQGAEEDVGPRGEHVAAQKAVAPGAVGRYTGR